MTEAAPTDHLRSRPARRRPRWASTVALLALLGASWAAGLVGTPYAHVGDELLRRLHAERVPCAPGAAATAVCFVAEPARAAVLAEELDLFVTEHGGALQRGSWSSGNGAYRATLHWSDDLWGGLEVWFAEQGAARVEGRLEHVLRRR